MRQDEDDGAQLLELLVWFKGEIQARMAPPHLYHSLHRLLYCSLNLSTPTPPHRSGSASTASRATSRTRASLAATTRPIFARSSSRKWPSGASTAAASAAARQAPRPPSNPPRSQPIIQVIGLLFNHATCLVVSHVSRRKSRARSPDAPQVKNEALDPRRAVLVARAHRASGGRELFLSFETPDRRALFGFLRLRFADDPAAQVSLSRRPLGCTCFVSLLFLYLCTCFVSLLFLYLCLASFGFWSRAHRLRTPRRARSSLSSRAPRSSGSSTCMARSSRFVPPTSPPSPYAHPCRADVGAGSGAQTYEDTEKEGGGAPQQQHAGLGRRLLQWAERLAWDAGFRRVAIISGVGVRRYYARLGSPARPLSPSARLEPLYRKTCARARRVQLVREEGRNVSS